MAFIPVDMIPQITSFLFVFAVVFGLLISAKVIPSKNANILIALVIGVFSVLYEPFVLFMQGIIPIAAIIMVILFFVVFIKKIFMPKKDKKKDEEMDALPIVVSLAMLLLVIGALWDKIQPYIPITIGADNVLWIIGIIVIIMIFYAAYTYAK